MHVIRENNETTSLFMHNVNFPILLSLFSRAAFLDEKMRGDPFPHHHRGSISHFILILETTG